MPSAQQLPSAPRDGNRRSENVESQAACGGSCELSPASLGDGLQVFAVACGPHAAARRARPILNARVNATDVKRPNLDWLLTLHARRGDKDTSRLLGAYRLGLGSPTRRGGGLWAWYAGVSGKCGDDGYDSEGFYLLSAENENTNGILIYAFPRGGG